MSFSTLPVQVLGLAILQPDDKFTAKRGFSKPALDHPLVVSCLAGVRARTAQLALLGAGYTNVRWGNYWATLYALKLFIYLLICLSVPDILSPLGMIIEWVAMAEMSPVSPDHSLLTMFTQPFLLSYYFSSIYPNIVKPLITGTQRGSEVPLFLWLIALLVSFNSSVCHRHQGITQYMPIHMNYHK